MGTEYNYLGRFKDSILRKLDILIPETQLHDAASLTSTRPDLCQHINKCIFLSLDFPCLPEKIPWSLLVFDYTLSCLVDCFNA